MGRNRRASRIKISQHETGEAKPSTDRRIARLSSLGLIPVEIESAVDTALRERRVLLIPVVDAELEAVAAMLIAH